MDLEKEELWSVALAMKPDYRRDAFDRHWEEFQALKEQAEALKAQGIAIHPDFGRLTH